MRIGSLRLQGPVERADGWKAAAERDFFQGQPVIGEHLLRRLDANIPKVSSRTKADFL